MQYILDAEEYRNLVPRSRIIEAEYRIKFLVETLNKAWECSSAEPLLSCLDCPISTHNQYTGNICNIER
jgi:hypothetical protein